MRAFTAAAGTGVERRGVAGHGQGPQLVRVEDQARCPTIVRGQSTEGADEQLELLHGRLSVVVDEPLGGLEHRGAGGVRGIVAAEVAGERRDRLDLRDDVEAAALGQLEVDVHERLEPSAEPRGGLADALGSRTDEPSISREERDDAVGLAQLVGAQHDAGITVEAHHPIVPHRTHVPPYPRPMTQAGYSDTPQLQKPASCPASACASWAPTRAGRSLEPLEDVEEGRRGPCDGARLRPHPRRAGRGRTLGRARLPVGCARWVAWPRKAAGPRQRGRRECCPRSRARGRDGGRQGRRPRRRLVGPQDRLAQGEPHRTHLQEGDQDRAGATTTSCDGRGQTAGFSCCSARRCDPRGRRRDGTFDARALGQEHDQVAAVRTASSP